MVVQGSEYLTIILHALSQSFMIPVIAGLLGMMFYMIVEFGGFLAEKRCRRRSADLKLVDRVKTLDGSQAWQVNNIHQILEDAPLEPEQRELLNGFLDKRNMNEESKRIIAKDILDSEEARFQRKLDRTELLAKIGPVLGLMGTLIPLGPGLGDLGQGNIQGLSQAMIIAFDTTVVGVAVGSAAAVVSKTRRRWYQQDLNRMELLLELMGGEDTLETEQEKKQTAIRS